MPDMFVCWLPSAACAFPALFQSVPPLRQTIMSGHDDVCILNDPLSFREALGDAGSNKRRRKLSGERELFCLKHGRKFVADKAPNQPSYWGLFKMAA
ncbi:hypothetical protein ElyMa_005631700 [Elysia marginata]|uniref:Uncharacterized protein n=1 Tax=Elysia marginata TaxID=1093978 RepID=A0AAV4F8B2_9GAST|nr:hypothetical protein ElyMa_005631700 [Elysia marginata]